jgi:hypothetical protein
VVTAVVVLVVDTDVDLIAIGADNADTETGVVDVSIEDSAVEDEDL